MKNIGKYIVAKTEAEFEAACAKAPGPVVVEFTSTGCDACKDEAPKVKAMVKQCAVTVVKVDVYKVEALAEKFDVQSMPVFFVAPSGGQMTPEGAKELQDAKAVRKHLKAK